MPQYNNPDRVCFSFMIYGIINFGEAFLYTEQKSLNYIRKTLISVVTYLVLIILSWIFDLASNLAIQHFRKVGLKVYHTETDL